MILLAERGGGVITVEGEFLQGGGTNDNWWKDKLEKGGGIIPGGRWTTVGRMVDYWKR